MSSTLQTVKSDLDTAEKSITTLQGRTLPLSVSFDIDKIDALTDSSGSTDIKAAFTPLSGRGVAPVAGNILRSGNVIKNSQEVTVIWSDYNSKTAYYSFSYVIDNVLKIFQTDAKTFVRVAKTIVGGDVGAEIEDLQDRVSIGKAPVWITMTLESEPHDPTRDNIGDIIFFEEGNYLKEVVRGATGGPTLGQTVDMETGRLYVYGGNLCKWEDGDFVPFYLDDINTLKSKARYEYSLSKILALTDISGEPAVEEAFTPTYDPEGSLAPRVPKAGDLLINGNNTVVVSEGTQIFFSFTYQEEIISMRVYGAGSSFRFNVWKFPAGTVYDFNSIDTLTESSTADDIKKALTPKIGDGMRIPNSGDIMLIGIEENPDTVSVLYRYRNTFAYYHNRLLTTIEVEVEDDSLRVVKTISRNYVYDFDKINALTNASTFSDILHAFSPLIMGSYTLLPKTGDLLTSGYDEAGDAARSAKVIYHNGNSFAYCYDGKHVTVKLVGKLGNPDMRVEKTVTDLAEDGYEPKKYDYDKVMALSNDSTELNVNEAFTPIGGSEPSTPMPGDLLVSTDDRNHVIILANTQTTASNAAINIKYIYGNILRNISVRFNPRFSISVADIELDKEVESGGALRITTSKISVLVSGGNGSYDLGVTFQQLQEAITNNQLIMGNIIGELYAAYSSSSNVTLMSVAYLQNDWRSVLITIPKYSGTTATVTVTTKLLTKFVQMKYKYNLKKIFALSSSSGTEDIEEAFTPTYAPDGNTAMRLPQSGDLLEATNGATSVVLKGLSKSFSFFYGDKRRDITLSGSAGNYKVAVVVTPLDARVFDLDKLNALTDESSSEDIDEALGGNFPTTGDLLKGANESSWVIMSSSETFTYHTGGKLRTLTVSGGPGSMTIEVEEKEVESGGALRITTSKISVLVSGGNGSYDLGVTFQQLQEAITNNQLIMGNIIGELYAAYSSSSNVTLMSVAYLQNDWRSVLITIPKYSGTTATVTVTTKLLTKFVQIPYSFLSGEIGGTYDNVKMSDLLAANIIQTDKGIATLDTTSGYVLSLIVDGTLYVRCTIDYSDNRGLKLTARTETPIVITQIDNDFRTTQSQVDIGISFDELKNTFFVMDKNGLLYYKGPTDHQNIIYISLFPYGESTTSFVNFAKLVIITDAGDGKINISPSGYQYKVPVLGSKDKLPAAVMPDSFIAGKGVTAIQTVTELPQSPDSGTLYLIVPSETTTSEEQL